MQLFLVFAFYYITSSTAFTIPNVAPRSNGNNLAPPPPAVGESVDQWLDQLFGPIESPSSNSSNITLSARSNAFAERDNSYTGGYREYNGIHELSWINESSKTSFNLTMDVSKSCTGLNLSSEIGLYTFTNGTTMAHTQLKDIISDVWSLAPTPSDRRRRWANHTEVLAQMAQSEADEILQSTLICQKKSATEVMVNAASGDFDMNPVHEDLRHLLSASGWSYWTATIISTIVGAGIGASLAAGLQHHFSGNITQQNVVQTAAVVGATVLIGGILMRLHENGRIDRLAEIANKYQGRQILLENTYIARLRAAVAEVRRQSVDRAWGGAVGQDAEGSNVDGQTTPGSLGGFSNLGGFTPQGTPRKNSGQFLCLSDQEAVEAMRALGQMTNKELQLRMLDTIHEYQMQRLENGEAGPSNAEDWSFCALPQDSSGVSPLESANPSFKTAKGGPGEASAADLVEMHDMGSSSGDGYSTEQTADGSPDGNAENEWAGMEGGNGEGAGYADAKGKGKATGGG